MDEVKVIELQTIVKKLKDQIKIKTETVIFNLGGHLLWDRPWEVRLWHRPRHWRPQS